MSEDLHRREIQTLPNRKNPNEINSMQEKALQNQTLADAKNSTHTPMMARRIPL